MSMSSLKRQLAFSELQVLLHHPSTEVSTPNMVRQRKQASMLPAETQMNKRKAARNEKIRPSVKTSLVREFGSTL